MAETTFDRYVSGIAGIDDAEAFPMTEEAFGLFYQRTARPLWAYLARMSGDRRLADDLLQETYYRFLKSGKELDDEGHRRNYLFRIATNLVLDTKRRPRMEQTFGAASRESGNSEPTVTPGTRPATDLAGEAARRVDVGRAMARLRPRDRALVWLAYVNGSSHKEIAEALGLQTTSIKLLLFRARRRLAALLDEAGQ